MGTVVLLGYGHMMWFVVITVCVCVRVYACQRPGGEASFCVICVGEGGSKVIFIVHKVTDE